MLPAELPPSSPRRNLSLGELPTFHLATGPYRLLPEEEFSPCALVWEKKGLVFSRNGDSDGQPQATINDSIPL